MRIGLMGAVVNSSNLGCVALTYSLLMFLEEIAKDNNMDFEYMIFEIQINEEKIRMLSETLGISMKKLHVTTYGTLESAKQMIRHVKLNLTMMQSIKKCDVIIDVTAGDSFTDIYGDGRFLSWTRIKLLVEKLGIPLILAPQTYGPFNKKRNKRLAKTVIEHASLVIARDELSANCINNFNKKKIFVTTDMAFKLPFELENEEHEKILIGLNISGLLVANKIEQTKTEFRLSVDYDNYIKELLNYFCTDDKYEIHLIPHVVEDYMAIQNMALSYTNLIIHEPFSNPIEVKNCIAKMNVFIGARMHATIGAFSAGVATIPTAYSRKFLGLFNNVGYKNVIDLQTLNTQEALKQTINYVENYQVLQNEICVCIPRINEKMKYTKELLNKAILSLTKVI